MFDDKKKDKAITRMFNQWSDLAQIRYLAISLLAYILYQSTECVLHTRKYSDWTMAVRCIDAQHVLDRLRYELFSRRVDEILFKNTLREDQDDRSLFNDVMIDYVKDIYNREIKTVLPNSIYPKIIRA